MRRALWMCAWWLACTSATPPPEAVETKTEVAVTPTPAPICEVGAARSCYPGPAGTQGVGRCKAGVETCTGQAWSECTDVVVPEVEEDCGTPDDDDCDGRLDDCPEHVALSIALTHAGHVSLEHCGEGLGVEYDERFLVIERGGGVIDLSELGQPGYDPDPDGGYWLSYQHGGAWPGAFLRSSDAYVARVGSELGQEQWDGSSFERVTNSDEYLQWSYEAAMPWRDGHAIALRRTEPSFEMIEEIDPDFVEDGVLSAEQRALQRKVKRLLAKAQPRLEIVPRKHVEARAPAFGLFGEIEGAGAPGEREAGAPEAGVAEAREGETPRVPRVPALPGGYDGFTVLADGRVAILLETGQVHTWTSGQATWTALEKPTLAAGLHPSLLSDGAELMIRACGAKDSRGVLLRHTGDGWVPLVLPTAECPHAIVTTPDGARFVLLGEQIWRRALGDADTWRKVPVPAPWRPRELAVFDGRLWIVGEGEKSWAVLVDREVPRVHVLVKSEEVTEGDDSPI